jgi:hypothetical protein
LRLVAQPILANKNHGVDFALHLVYEPQKSMVNYLKELVALRAGSTTTVIGKPLGIHPILSSEGMSGSYGKALRSFLVNNLKASNMKQIATSFIEPMRLQPWIFFFDNAQNFNSVNNLSVFAFDPQSSPRGCDVPKQHICVPSYRGSKSSPFKDSSWVRQNSREKGATRTSLDGKTPPFLDDFMTDAKRLGEKNIVANLSKWEGVINHIDNPKMITQAGTNCASCHRTSTERFTREGAVAGFKIEPRTGRNAYKPNNTSGCTDGLGLKLTGGNTHTINVRHFGYTHTLPMISQRVVNETVLACEILKRSLR